MNLINLPMGDSAVHRKMMAGSGAAHEAAGENKSTRSTSAPGKRIHVPDVITAQLQQFGVHKKARKTEVDPTEQPDKPMIHGDENSVPVDPTGMDITDAEIITDGDAAGSCAGGDRADASGGKLCTHSLMVTCVCDVSQSHDVSCQSYLCCS